MKRGEIVYVKAEVVSVLEGAAIVKVLNGFGEPEIVTGTESVLMRDGRDGALVAAR